MCVVTTGDAQRATENIDGAPQLDSDQQEAEATATAPETQSATASPAPTTEEYPDIPPASVPRSPTPPPQQAAAGAAATWAKAATVATAAGTLLAAFAAVGALYFSNSALSASTDQLELSRQTAQSELFKSASEQLDSDKVSVRLSGVYLLERLAQSSVADQPTVRRLLQAFVITETTTEPCKPPERAAPVDIQAASRVIAKYAALPEDPVPVNLDGACLAAANLRGANFTDASLEETCLYGVHLGEANLTGANLGEATLAGAFLGEANFTDAFLGEANLAHAFLGGANLTRAFLSAADLTGVDLRGAVLTGANLRGAVLTGAIYDESTRWPEGFVPPQSA